MKKKKKKNINLVSVIPDVDLPLISAELVAEMSQVTATVDSVRKGIRKAFQK